VLTNGIAAMGDTWYNVIAHPYYDATSLTALETELTSRNGPMRQIDGVAITSMPGTLSTIATLSQSRNNRHSLIFAQPGKVVVTSPCEFAAAVAAAIAFAGADDPARPFQTLQLPGVKAPALADLFMNSERNLMLFDGISTSLVAGGGVVQIERAITTYETNEAGAPDTSYLDLMTLLTLMYLRYSFRVRMQTKYPRHKLAGDDVRPDSGQAVITPKIGKSEAIAWFKEMQGKLLVEGLDQFKQDLVVERNASDPNRLDFLLPPDLINALIVTAAKIQFGL
jgi:phage tail sheath gpL-like